jgi:succinate dehydrogenase/fumarate reductase flavoprotein subunit
MNSMVFLKGYQWPFDSRKVEGGSSLVDIFVYIETVVKGRRVFLDFRGNPEGFKFEDLSDEAREYLENSEALQATPIERLRKMNPGAIELYLDHNIDIIKDPLEVAVCAQHNNGGLAGNHWWESLNISHLFPIGEVNGSHGVYRPGGSALNSGQVGAIRAAEYIANRYGEWTLDEKLAEVRAAEAAAGVMAFIGKCSSAEKSWQDERNELQLRMSKSGAQIRNRAALVSALAEAKEQLARIRLKGCAAEGEKSIVEALRNLQLCFAHMAYLDAILFSVESGVGSRGSAMTLDLSGKSPHAALGEEWNFEVENPGFRQQVMETHFDGDAVSHKWIPRREIPESNLWFETAWADYREGKIFG